MTHGKDAPPEILFGRYEAVRLLKEGQGNKTFLATESASHQPVVIKTIPAPAGGADVRFEHEAAVLRKLTTPGLAPLLSYGRDNGTLYIVTPFVPGTTLQERLRSRPLEPREVLSIATSVLRSLGEAHELGIIHRDVKPSNIIVSGRAGDEITTLIDFGLSRTQSLDPSLRDVPVGTALYMAPEQAGLLDGEVDERADLYSLGAVLFECLSGRPPFQGSNLGEVLRQHLTEKPPDLRELGVNVPRALDELIRRLLAKDPHDRYQSANGVLTDVEEIAAALDRGEAEPLVVVGMRDARRSLADPAFVGRDAELSSLSAELDRARHGGGHVVLVEAESGGGKTRLLEEFAHRAALENAHVYRGQGVDQAAQRPFEVLRGAAQGLLERWKSEPGLDGYVRTRLGDRCDAVCAALPELTTFLDAGVAHIGPEEFGENRTIEALEVLVTSLGTPEHPAVLVLDDCQWADELTLKLLARWDADRQHTTRNVLVCVAFRTEEIGPGHLLRSIENPIRLELEPLRSEDVRLLVESMAGPIPEQAIAVVVELAEGSPFMASAVLRGLIESRALVDGPGGWETVPDALAEASASRRAGAFLARRLELLSSSTLRLLEAGAVLGKEFDVGLALTLIGPDTAGPEALEEARRRHMVWVRDSRSAFVHDKIREAVLDRLPSEVRRALHVSAAERIRSLDEGRVFEIAYHLDAAGEVEQALPFAIAAAELARTQHGLAVSQRNYEIAARSTRMDPKTRLRVAEGLGDVLMLRGLYETASSQFEHALSLTDDPFERARIEGKIGELAFKRGDVKSGTESIERALRALGHRMPKKLTGAILPLPWLIFVQALHTLFPRRFVGRRSLDTAGPDLLAVRHFDRLAYSYWFYRGPMWALWAQLHGLNLAERYPPTAELAKSCSTHTAALSVIVPLFTRRAVAYAKRSLAIWEQIGDLWGEGQALNFWSVGLYCAGRFAESLEKSREASKLLERAGDPWEANTAAWHAAYCLYHLGDRAGAVDAARRVHRTGVEIGDAQARGIGLSVWSKASDGKLPDDLVITELEAPTDDTHKAIEVVMAEGARLLGSGRPSDAARVLASGLHLLRTTRVLQVYVAPLFVWYTRALRLETERTYAYQRQSRRRLRTKWRRAVRLASLLAHIYPNDRAYTYREAALSQAFAGRERRARKLFDRSIAAADALSQYHERATTLLERGRVGLLLGWTEAVDDLAAGQQLLQEMGAEPDIETVTVSLLDRFDSVLEQGREIASALTKDEIYDAVREASITLLRPERCAVLEVRYNNSATPELRPIVGSAGGEFSRTVAGRALEEGKPVVISEGDAIGEVSESLVLAGVRSSLAAPILVRGRSAACFYLEHRGVGGLFGADEVRIAEFIATVAGAALENAEGFAEIQDLTRTLERRVEERTGELGDTNRRLERTLEDLRRLDQLKTEFMAIAAHDLRTPLTVIAGFAATLHDNWDAFDEPNKRTFVSRINANTKRMAEFVENLLSFGRIESGELGYNIRPFDLEALVRRTVGEQSATADSSRFAVRIEEGLPLAMGDEERTWQVLNNLLSNALKFSSTEAPVSLDVSLNGDMLAVAVGDKGPGISMQDQAKLFVKFSRVDRSDGQKSPLGTGLGLYISKSIVEAQGGEITLRSEAGAGATFTFTLPAALADQMQGAA